ncbi:pyrimidine reductase family protein [Mycolicibacterium komossense]|uniref:Pyrimidine reductase family protein n=1 Tax=Mycolicibacterium komossense TaxID=1779 RepID=A0ABT3CHK5_9MYCO|nr:pyrimidine reductase family protein [Mycolicibacterium komossense]MCV7228932.1 pyrimidine reductase family protein [Mycolicibacterium komossense]
MAEPTAGTQLTLLGTADTVDESRLPELYEYPADISRCCVRANFISTLDGSASVDGKSGGLGGPGDRALFRLMRELADVIVVGAGTVRAENYAGAQLSVTQRQNRQARGQAEIPPIAIVTQSGHLDRDTKVFTQTEVPPLVLTCTAAAADTRDRLHGLAEVIDCSGPDPASLDTATMLELLAARKLTRVLTEGGPSLLGTFIENDLIDELCLTIAPVIVGGDGGRIAKATSAITTKLRRAHLLADDSGYLYSRYVAH